MNQQQVLHSPFNIEIHKKTFTDYLEVIISEDGTIMYAVPSHQEKLISIACEKLNVDRDQLNDMCPKEYYFDFMFWLCKITGCVSLWNEHMEGVANEKQQIAINELIESGLYRGLIKS